MQLIQFKRNRNPDAQLLGLSYLLPRKLMLLGMARHGMDDLRQN